MIHQIKSNLILNAKNIIGWKTKKKYVVFSVDDYGNVRLDSAEARARLDAAGMKIYSRFDALDTLETTQDLEQLFEVLSSVKGQDGKPAVFSPFALPCNIDFDAMSKNGYTEYAYENLDLTYQKLAQLQPKAYTGAWNLWREGISSGLMRPEFHGREHLNLHVLNDKLAKRDVHVLTALQNRSYTSISDDEYPAHSSMAAYDFWDTSELEPMKENLRDGLVRFEQVYGYKSDYFTPPVYHIHHSLYPTLVENGIKYIDLDLVRQEHQGFGKYKREFNYTSRKTSEGLQVMVRNVVFEPTEDRGLDWTAFTMKQIEAAFRWNRPAIISSHRVNFCGHIDPNNRTKGLVELKKLLHAITTKWPDVVFISASDLGKIISR
ncbi:hypothetical protein KIH23_03865 [Flavobacterium sp. CYK-55]|uniref:hypothetical protein n=1 Tax=Flavobacterium sp. CYK-55 TaxID=2835529 RepID=UPI001BCE1BBB|nr:hypothetical protein [Flavobacterium sp. CYK-55]MBS7786423.1 hypothetical protein [Flavobacterium sp. CYK-55]